MQNKMTNLPQGWEVKKLEDVCKNSSSNLALKDIKDKSGDYPVFGASGIVGYIDFYHKNKECLGIVKDGAGVGRVFVLPKNTSVIGTLNYLEALENTNLKYLFYFLCSIDFSKYILGSAIPHIYFRDYKKEQIPLPPLKEQERIVGILDESFAKIDESIKILEQDLLNLDELVQSALQKAFNPLKDNAKENYKLPQGWKMETLGEILSSNKYSIKRGPFGSSLKKSFFVEKGIRIFEQYNPINNDPHWKRYFISHEKFKELEAFKATEGDLLISCSGTLGKIVELPKDTEMGIINQALLKIRLNNIKILNSYFIYYFNSPIMQEKILESTLGSAIKNIASVKILKQIEIPLPPLKEQEQIASHLDELSSHVKNLKQNYQAQIKDLQELKNSLLDKAFKGNL
ncbi:restriction endonuclease subunit S [Campylobacter coli]|nr:restriction endonuclease subunit S [Campylobacter coli]EAL0080491.1 restriction endonuclease subunit S [Campylobacter lari]EAI1510773.1 restriction endonuclease subunit S [Campylobacter coli]EFL6827244.1 restriction endonuclease subunit S [Campylobacter coli]EFV1823150.1 restriction endonuclease subunit S [Campylobacter coli]